MDGQTVYIHPCIAYDTQKDSLFCLKKPHTCQKCLPFCLRNHEIIIKVHYFIKKVQYFVEKVYNLYKRTTRLEFLATGLLLLV